jgi:hypothetical protein
MDMMPRSMNRATWKMLWRQIRITKREVLKATMDTMVFGTGFCRIGDNVSDLIEHVPVHQIIVSSTSDGDKPSS